MRYIVAIMKAASLHTFASRFRSRRGVALISVLWVLVLLSLIAASLSRTSRTEVEFARNLLENAKAEALADAAVYRAVIGLSEPLEADKWLADGTPYELSFPEGNVQVTILDEVGKIDLNEGQDSLFQALFTLAGVEPEVSWGLVDAIVDFRDTDHNAEQRGAEDNSYKAAGLPHDAKDAPFESVEELRQVMGMTYDLYEKVAPLLTVHSRRAGFNPKFAPKEVLLLLPGANEDKVNEFLEERSLYNEKRIEAQGQEETGSEAGSGEVSNIDEDDEDNDSRRKRKRREDRSDPVGDDRKLLEILGVTPEISQFFTSGRSRGTVTVRAEAQTPTGARFVREALLQLQRGQLENVRFHSWRRGAGTRLLPEKNDSDEVEEQ